MWSSMRLGLLEAQISEQLKDSNTLVLRLYQSLGYFASSFSAPHVQHFLCCSPSTDHPALLEFDELLGSSVSLVFNSVVFE